MSVSAGNRVVYHVEDETREAIAEVFPGYLVAGEASVDESSVEVGEGQRSVPWGAKIGGNPEWTCGIIKF